MKKLLSLLLCFVLAFLFIMPAYAVQSQNKLTPPPEILSFSADGDMSAFLVEFSHSLDDAEQLREMVYELALESYKSQQALLASPEYYLACRTKLFLEMSGDSFNWSCIRELNESKVTITRDEITAFAQKSNSSRVFIRICLASENSYTEGTGKVYIYAPSEHVTAYISADGSVIPTGTRLIFAEALPDTLTLFTPSIKGYTFDGWSAENDVRINSVPAGTREIFLKAHFIPMVYEINYVLTTDISYPFGRADNTKNPIEYEVGTGARLLSINSPVVGYSFGGWYTTPDFSGEKITVINPWETGVKLFYARWISDEEVAQEKYRERMQYIADNKLGDPDGDGQITAADARYVLRAAVGIEQPDYERLRRVDFFNNGKISSDNARTTLRIAVGLDNLYDILLENGLLP